MSPVRACELKSVPKPQDVSAIGLVLPILLASDRFEYLDFKDVVLGTIAIVGQHFNCDISILSARMIRIERWQGL